MSLLEKASLVVTPNAYKTSKLYSVVPSDGSGDMTVVRATTATRVNSAGLIKSVGVNVPRIDYTNGSCPSLLVEPQRANLLTYSEQFDDVSWTKNAASITSNVAISPNGILNAEKLIEDSTNGIHFIQAAPFIFSNSTYSVSIYAKAAERSVIQIFLNGLINTNDYANFDLINGIAYPFGAATATIQSLINGWYKCTLIINAAAGTAPSNYYCIQNSTSAARAASYLGNGTSGVYIWGAQLEQGSYATSYIPTIATSVTRNADAISKTGISSLIGQTEGTIFWEGYLNGSVNTGQLVGVGKSGLDVIRIQKEGLLVLSVQVYNNGFAFIQTFPFVNGYNKIAFVYKSGNSFCYLNGTKMVFNTTSFTPTGILDEITINNLWQSNSDITLQNINSVQLYKTALSDTECINLTTI